MVIYLFPVNQGRADCAADAHADHYMLTQADAVKRSRDALLRLPPSSRTTLPSAQHQRTPPPAPARPPPVLPYLSSMPLALAFYDVELNHMPIVNVTTRRSPPSPWDDLYVRAANGTVLGPVGNTDLWFNFSNPRARQVYVEQLVQAVAARTSTTFPGAAGGTIIPQPSSAAPAATQAAAAAAAPGPSAPKGAHARATAEACEDRCRAHSECRAVTWVSQAGQNTPLSNR